MSEEKNSKMVLLTGLWVGATHDGTRMLSGNLTRSSRVVILPNKQKRKDNEADAKKPDYLVFVASNDPAPSKPDSGF